MMDIVSVDFEKVAAFKTLIVTKTQGPQEAFALLCLLLIEVYKMDHFEFPDPEVIANEVKASITSVMPPQGTA